MENKRDYTWSNIMVSLENARTAAHSLDDSSRFGYERQTVLETLEEFTKQLDKLKQKYDTIIYEERLYG
ncbi:hypothetical protein C7120_08980 [Prevotella sp. oral taxon 376]|uniref:hypothetical protein n=1 Tax=Prevotella sp. oral taxon 376 TaxID=712466 RepID=UPI000D1F06A3|nr:hypothetical protein [Prevotella sp. oral taxon 376]PTL34623.1 hypothetical protein C7120_08980 [Prevotella sp. oral taxon 376]